MFMSNMGNLCYTSRHSRIINCETQPISTEIFFDYDRQKRQEEFVDELKQKGHTCIIYIETYPVSIGWCKQEICERSL